MTPGYPEKEAPAHAPIYGWARILLATAGIAVLVVSVLMAYRENAATTAPVRDAESNKMSFAFNIYSQPRALPNVRFTDGNGRTMTLQNFRGKFILLNVWATWCPPCRKEMPTLDRLQTNLGGPDFEVAALSIDQGQKSLSLVQEFYLQSGVKSLGIYLDSSGDASRDLKVTGLPTTLLIDREGREIGRKIGPAEWDGPEIVTLIRGYLTQPASLP